MAAVSEGLGYPTAVSVLWLVGVYGVDGGGVMPWWLVWLVCNVAFVAGAWWASRDRV